MYKLSPVGDISIDRIAELKIIHIIFLHKSNSTELTHDHGKYKQVQYQQYQKDYSPELKKQHIYIFFKYLQYIPLLASVNFESFKFHNFAVPSSLAVIKTGSTG